MKLKGKFPALAAIVESVAVPKGSGPCCLCHQGMAKQDLYQLCPDCQMEISNASELGLDYGSIAAVMASSPYAAVEQVLAEREGWTNNGAYEAARSFYNNQSDFKAGEAIFNKEGKAPLVGFLKKKYGLNPEAAEELASDAIAEHFSAL